jgi:hypothetical protein
VTGWPSPPYRVPNGVLEEHLDAHGWVLLPQDRSRSTHRMLVEALVRWQATRDLAVRRVRDERGADALLVCDRAAWPCHGEEEE